MAKKIILDADLTRISKAFKKTFSEVEKMAPKKMNMGFDFENIKKWKSANIDAFKNASTGATNAKNKMREFTQEVKKLASLKSQMSGTEFFEKFGDELERAEKGFKGAAKEAKGFLSVIKDIQKSSGKANFMQRYGAKLRHQASSAGEEGGMADLAGGALGGIGDAMQTLAPAASFISGVGSAYMFARKIAAPRRALAERNMEMMGLSSGNLSSEDLKNMRRSGVGYGFTGEETMNSAIGLQREAGEVGNSAMERFSRLRRQTGLGAEELTGMTGAFRSAATGPKGADLESNLKEMGKMYSQATASALDKSGALRYMQITSQMTNKIANEGSADVDSIKDTLSELAMQSDFFKANPNRSAAALQGGENFFRSAEGTGLAMLTMQGMKDKSGKSLTAGKDPMEMLLMQKMGFTEGGFDVGGKHFQGVGGGGLESLTQQMGSLVGINNKEDLKKASRAQTALLTNAIAENFNVSPSLAGNLIDASFGGRAISAEDRKKFGQTPADKTQDSLDRMISQNEATMNEVKLSLGDHLAGTMVNIEGQVTKIANYLLDISDSDMNSPFIDAQDKENARDAAEKQVAFMKAVNDPTISRDAVSINLPKSMADASISDNVTPTPPPAVGQKDPSVALAAAADKLSDAADKHADAADKHMDAADKQADVFDIKKVWSNAFGTQGN